jgi:DNA-binding CsgD family transcriptional regulator
MPKKNGKAPNNPGRRKQMAQVAERRKQVATLMITGLSYREMAKMFGVSHVTIAKDVNALIKQWAADQKPEQVTRWRIKENLKLDRLERILAPRLPNELQAVDRYLRVMERRAKLNGLDLPARIDVTSNDQSISTVDEEATKLMTAIVSAVKDANID